MQEIVKTIVGLGVDPYTLLLVSFLPVVATISGIARHILGVKTLSLYAPIVLTYAYIEIGFDRVTGVIDFWEGFIYGLIITIIVFLTATFIYASTRQLRLHYFPKIALVFTAISTILLATIIIAAQLGVNGIININIFALVMIAAVSERLVSTYAKTNFNNTLYIGLETMVLAFFNLALISWVEFQEVLLTSPWVFFLIVIINIYVGKFTDLRLREYWRFYSILNSDQDDQKEE